MECPAGKLEVPRIEAMSGDNMAGHGRKVSRAFGGKRERYKGKVQGARPVVRHGARCVPHGGKRKEVLIFT